MVFLFLLEWSGGAAKWPVGNAGLAVCRDTLTVMFDCISERK